MLLHLELLWLHEGLVVHHLLGLSAISSVLAALTVAFLFSLLNGTKLAFPVIEVGILSFLDQTVDTVDLELVGVNLGLIVLELSNKIFELLAAVLKVLLVLDKLLFDIGATLLSKNVLQLNVELFLLLNQDIFLRDLFSLCDQALLQALDLLNQFVGLDAGRFEFTPPVDVEGLFKLVLKVLCLLLLLQKLLF